MSVVASIVGWHPVETFLHGHRRELHVAIVALYVLAVPMPIVLLFAPIAERDPTRIEESLVPPAYALFALGGWLVPFGLGSSIDPGAPPWLAVAPLVLLFPWVGVSWIVTKLYDRLQHLGRRLHAALRSRGGRLLLSSIAAAWFFVFEAVLFLFLDEPHVKVRWIVFPLAVLAYLPIRFVLQVLTQPGRAERWSMMIAFSYLFVRIGTAW